MKSEDSVTQSSTTSLENRGPVQLQSLAMVQIGMGPRIIAALLVITFFISLLFVLLLPWRQFVVGAGEIIVFSPMERPQTIESQITGRLLNWYVRDGELVHRGQLIADLSDIDPRYLASGQLETMMEQKKALIAKRKSAQEKEHTLGSQLDNTSTSRGAAIPAAQQRINQAKDRVGAAQQSVDVAEQNVKTADAQLQRVSSMFDKGLKSQRDQQVALLDNVKAKTELQRAKAALAVVDKDASIAALDYQRTLADTGASVDSVRASISDANQMVASTTADIQKLEIDIRNLSERIGQRKVVAPCAGRVVRLNRVGSGETVAAGAELATIVPGTEDRAAAIMVRDYDAPLVTIGSPVRLAISGWPSLQFVGWPSVAVGTFAGRVSVIDAVDDGKHLYRVIVVPDFKAIRAKKEEPWPTSNFLRPGAKATGWILLSDVPLWYELWRQFNGFQPTVPGPETDSATGQSKQP